MHRSGTSIIGGLINKMGLKTGGPLIRPAIDNERGFFERIDVVLQNDIFMQQQKVHYAFHTEKYDALKALHTVYLTKKEELFKEGDRGLAFLNDPLNYPYMLKDPRLCITLRTWLPLLKSLPVILFTFRHPLDVALSLHNREQEHFRIARGLRLWYVYNRRAIQQSHDLCRVVASHKYIMLQPREQFDRIFTELRACGLNVPRKLSNDEIASFIDVKLQHGKSGSIDAACLLDANAFQSLPPPESWIKAENEKEPNSQELSIYREAMRVYCAMESGAAFHADFIWDEKMKDAGGD